jgi:hypothetical protein
MGGGGLHDSFRSRDTHMTRLWFIQLLLLAARRGLVWLTAPPTPLQLYKRVNFWREPPERAKREREGKEPVTWGGGYGRSGGESSHNRWWWSKGPPAQVVDCGRGGGRGAVNLLSDASGPQTHKPWRKEGGRG